MKNKLNIEAEQVANLLRDVKRFKTTLSKNITENKVNNVLKFAKNGVYFLEHSTNLQGIKYGAFTVFIDLKNFTYNIVDFYRILNGEKPLMKYTDPRDDVNYNKWLAKGNKQQFIKYETRYYLRFLKEYIFNDLDSIQSEILYKLDPKEHNINYDYLIATFKQWRNLHAGHMFPHSKKRNVFESLALMRDLKNGNGSGMEFTINY